MITALVILAFTFASACAIVAWHERRVVRIGQRFNPDDYYWITAALATDEQFREAVEHARFHCQ